MLTTTQGRMIRVRCLHVRTRSGCMWRHWLGHWSRRYEACRGPGLSGLITATERRRGQSEAARTGDHRLSGRAEAFALIRPIKSNNPKKHESRKHVVSASR